MSVAFRAYATTLKIQENVKDPSMNFAIWFDWSRKKTRQANKAGLALIEIQDEILVTIPEGDIVSNIEEKLKETMAEEEKLSGKGLEVEKHDFMKAFESSCKINK